MRSRIAAVATAVAAVGLALLISPAAHAAPAYGDASQPAEQRFYWEWSDGADAKTRTFRESEYELPENLPQLLVFAEPAKPSQYIKLQYRQNGTWRREDAKLTNARGVARLSLNPYCNDGNWCNGTYKYRLLVNGRYTNFTVTYDD